MGLRALRSSDGGGGDAIIKITYWAQWTEPRYEPQYKNKQVHFLLIVSYSSVNGTGGMGQQVPGNNRPPLEAQGPAVWLVHVLYPNHPFTVPNPHPLTLPRPPHTPSLYGVPNTAAFAGLSSLRCAPGALPQMCCVVAQYTPD